MSKRELSESDIKAKFITPELLKAGWDELTQIRREVYFTDGQVHVRGKVYSRGKRNYADYILYWKPSIPIALIEAKENNLSLGSGMQQALRYAEILDIPFVFTSNGDAFLLHDRTGQGELLEREIPLHEFPSPEKLWRSYCTWKGIDAGEEEVITQSYHDDGLQKEPRYYQQIAINRTVEAIAKGENRILLVMATGTGKTYTAFQIIWRLWKSGTKKRILFLADRNVLVDQTMVNDFRPFSGAMAKLSTRSKTIERESGEVEVLPTAINKKHRRIDTSYEIYLSLYQAITGPAEEQKLYKELSPDFFDLIIIDECHRGSAAEDSAWREILDYFSSATQIGMTATPKETAYVSNINYFGDPIYTYSLKQGIQDGFLAPYKVVKVHLDVDIEGYRPGAGEIDRYGNEIEDRIYNQKDFVRSLVIDQRTELVAKKITQFLKETNDRFQKTIVFCTDTEHADRMRRALMNENRDLVLENSRYVMRITGDDAEGTAQLSNFIDPESRYPVLVTTSQLLSTGVDARTCQLIVLDRVVGSMTEFKQIVGRGTRIYQDTGKYFFTLMDFRKATNHFADPDFDGEPVQIYEPKPDDPVAPPDEGVEGGDGRGEDPITTAHPGGTGGGGVREHPRKYYVSGREVKIVAERVEYLDGAGKLITESLRDYTKKRVREQFASLDDFLNRWLSANRTQALLEELENQGLPLSALAEMIGVELDPFDLICHVAFDQPPLTRRERAANVRQQNIFSRYGEGARAVLDALLHKYEDDGLVGLNDIRILQIPPLDQLGTTVQLVNQFGGQEGYARAVQEMQRALYEYAA